MPKARTAAAERERAKYYENTLAAMELVADVIQDGDPIRPTGVLAERFAVLAARISLALALAPREDQAK